MQNLQESSNRERSRDFLNVEEGAGAVAGQLDLYRTPSRHVPTLVGDRLAGGQQILDRKRHGLFGEHTNIPSWPEDSVPVEDTRTATEQLDVNALPSSGVQAFGLMGTINVVGQPTLADGRLGEDEQDSGCDRHGLLAGHLGLNTLYNMPDAGQQGPYHKSSHHVPTLVDDGHAGDQHILVHKHHRLSDEHSTTPPWPEDPAPMLGTRTATEQLDVNASSEDQVIGFLGTMNDAGRLTLIDN